MERNSSPWLTGFVLVDDMRACVCVCMPVPVRVCVLRVSHRHVRHHVFLVVKTCCAERLLLPTYVYPATFPQTGVARGDGHATGANYRTFWTSSSLNWRPTMVTEYYQNSDPGTHRDTTGPCPINYLFFHVRTTKRLSVFFKNAYSNTLIEYMVPNKLRPLVQVSG